MGAGWGEAFALPFMVRRPEGLERSGLILSEHSVVGRGGEVVPVICSWEDLSCTSAFYTSRPEPALNAQARGWLLIASISGALKKAFALSGVRGQ